MLLTADRSGERIDAALARLAPELSRSAAQKLLEGGGVPGDHIKALVACSRSIPLPVQARNAPARQLPQQQIGFTPCFKPQPADEQTVFHRSSHIHGQANQTLPIPIQQRPLPLHPALPSL